MAIMLLTLLGVAGAAAGAGADGPAPADAAPPSAWARLDRTLGGWISPGTLAEPHVELEGVSQCLSCHTALSATPDARCLDCHEDIGERMRERVGVHGRFEGRCASCHAEHRGLDADLLGLDREAFNHEQARFQLRGAHTRIDCEDCHLRRGPEAKVERFHPVGVAFAACADCHESPHAEAFLDGRDCGVCHTEQSFAADGLVLAGVAHESGGAAAQAASAQAATAAIASASPPPEGPPVAAGFSHDRDTRFPLAGRHASVPCEGCHTSEREALEREQGLDPGRGAPSECASCHEDPHRGAIRRACTTCHDPGGWTDPKAPFDHARLTRFALDRVHAALACSACHEDERFRAASTECSGCHRDAAALLAGRFGTAAAEPDPHEGRVACTDCHAPDAPARDLLAYQRACVRCHPPQYATLLLSRRRVLDGLVVDAESRLRRLELARERGDAAASDLDLGALAERVRRLARSGLHHPELAEAVLRSELERLARAGSEAR